MGREGGRGRRRTVHVTPSHVAASSQPALVVGAATNVALLVYSPSAYVAAYANVPATAAAYAAVLVKVQSRVSASLSESTAAHAAAVVLAAQASTKSPWSPTDWS